jgi:hypothetical protein
LEKLNLLYEELFETPPQLTVKVCRPIRATFTFYGGTQSIPVTELPQNLSVWMTGRKKNYEQTACPFL